jgi:hypothetical protein
MPGMLRKSAAFAPRYRKFESISLQGRVRCEPDLGGQGHRLEARAHEARGLTEAMPVAAAIVGNDSMGAVLAARDVAAERLSTAALDG